MTRLGQPEGWRNLFGIPTKTGIHGRARYASRDRGTVRRGLPAPYSGSHAHGWQREDPATALLFDWCLFDLRSLDILEFRRRGMKHERRNAGVDHRVQDERAEHVLRDPEIGV